jgi:hypothetical protein
VISVLQKSEDKREGSIHIQLKIKRMDRTISAVGKQYVLHILCAFALSYAVCKTSVLYNIFISPPPAQTHIFFPYFIKGKIFEKIILYIKCVGHAVAQLVEVLLYKPEVRGFDS